jgi:hypothetical protein
MGQVREKIFDYSCTFVFDSSVCCFVMKKIKNVYFCEPRHRNFDEDCIQSVDCFQQYSHFYNIYFAGPWTWEFFPSSSVFFNFFLQGFTFYIVVVFISLVRFIPRYLSFLRLLWMGSFLDFFLSLIVIEFKHYIE